MGFCPELGCWGCGTAGLLGVLKDQSLGSVAAPADGDAAQGAPWSIHWRRTSRSSSGNFGFLGGIFSSPRWAAAWYSRLSGALPGTTAGPRSPPSSIISRRRRSRPPLSLAPWQPRHDRSRIARAAWARSGVEAVVDES